MRFLLPAQRDKPIPVVIILHYWGATDQRIERELARELAANNIAGLMVTLPYHLTRTPPHFRSGELAVQPDPEKLTGTMTQSVLDVRRAIDFIQTRPEFDHTKIGIAGTSLGSLVSVLSYAIDTRINVAAFMLGGADLAHILWHSSRVVQERDALRRRGYTEARMRKELETIEPLGYLASRPEGKTFVVGAKFDTVIPRVDTEKLIHALPNVKTLWLDTGHYGGVFVQTRIIRTVNNFFIQAFKGTSFTTPRRLYAPTVRFGVQYNTDTSLQVAAGIDLWKSNGRGDVFSSIFATPKGPELFLGAQLTHGFSLGIFGTPRTVSIGLLWSSVL